MYLAYSALLSLFFLASLPGLLLSRFRRGKSWGRLADRLGRLPEAVNPTHQRSVWVHAVSVGEVRTVRALLTELRRHYPAHRIVLSTTTATGQTVAEGLGDAVDATCFAPLDLDPFVSRALDRVAPDLMLFVDTEIWPNWLRACRRRGVRTVVVNGRISDRSFRRYRRVRRGLARVLDDLTLVCAQTEEWGRRFVELGLPADRVRVTGNLKFDALEVTATGADLHVADRVLGAFAFAAGRPVLIAASTLEGEEAAALRAFDRVRSTQPDAVLVLAPRHPERAPAVVDVVRRFGETVIRRSELLARPEGATVVVLDTVGELARLFQLATVVFVGGSLVPAGGHNILEPAVFGKPVIFGPHMRNFAEVARLFLAAEAGRQVASASELASVVEELFAQPVARARLGARAQALVEEHRGASARTAAALTVALAPDAPAAASPPPLRAVP